MSEQEAVPATSHQIPSMRLPWHVRYCRRLWSVLLFIWGPLITGIFVSTIANVNTTTTDMPLSQLLIIHLALVFPIPFFSGLGLLIILTLVCGIGKRNASTSGPIPPQKQKRACFLTRLYNRYTRLLEHSTQGVVQFPLVLHSAPCAVLNATRVRLHLHQAKISEQAVPDGTSLVQLYDQASGELLILGNPGTGKTTLLLQLAMVLQQRAVQDEHAPLPVVVNLST